MECGIMGELVDGTSSVVILKLRARLSLTNFFSIYKLWQLRMIGSYPWLGGYRIGVTSASQLVRRRFSLMTSLGC